MSFNPEDIVGKQFNELTVLEIAGRVNGNGELQYRCHCSCGNETVVRRSDLLKGTTKACGHLRRSTFDPQSIIGQKFNKWTVVEFSHRYKSLWLYRCRCECGNESIVSFSGLKSDASKSCGHCVEPWIEEAEDSLRYHCADGRTFLFSPEDIEIVKGRRWCMRDDGYVISTDDRTRLTRLIMGADDNVFVDHINNDPSDNRRSNLRLASSQQNNQNTLLRKTNTSGYKGVSLNKHAGKYESYVWKDYKRHYLGLFSTAEEAALARDEAARELHGEFACVNFPLPGEQGCRERTAVQGG